MEHSTTAAVYCVCAVSAYFFCFQTLPKRRVVQRRNLARRRVTTMSRTSLSFYVYRGRRYEKNNIFAQMRPHRPRRFAAVSHCRQRVGPVWPTQTGCRPWSVSRTVHRPVCRSLMQVTDLSGLALLCLPKTT